MFHKVKSRPFSGKKSIFSVAMAMTFAIGLIMLAGCGSGGGASSHQTETTEHSDHGDAHMEESNEHEEHDHTSSGHMDHMKDVRSWLKEELGDKYDEVVPEATNKQLALGKAKFDLICSVCHGSSGKGDGSAVSGLAQKPSDFTDPAHSNYYSDAGRIHIIAKGSPGTAMTGWESALRADEIQAVYMYVRSLRAESGDDEHDHGDGMYTCSMHPEVSGNKGGECPKCGMDLIPKEHGHDDEVEEQGHEDGHDH